MHSDGQEPELTPRQEELLDDIAAGEREPEDPEVQEAARDPGFAAALEQLRDAVALLRSERGHLRDALAEEAREEDVLLARRSLMAAAAAGPGSAPAEASGRSAGNGSTDAPRGVIGRILPWAAAAAAVLFLSLWLLDGSGNGEPPDPGGQSLDGNGQLRFEAERIVAGETLSWTPTEQETVTGYRLVVTDPDGVPVWESTVLPNPRWTPRIDLVDAWPDQVRVRVLALDDGLRTVEACPFVVMPVSR